LNQIDENFIEQNNARIIATFSFQPRFRQEFTQAEKKKEKVSADERRLLMATNIYQYKFTLTQIAEIIGFSACKSTKLFKRLEQAEMIKIISIVKGKGISKYPVLLPEAYKLLEIEEKKFYGKGAGYEHVIWQHLIAEHFKDCNAEIEKNVNGKFIDVAIKHENMLIAIEIAMTSAHEKENINKDINLAHTDMVIIACKDEKVLKEVKTIINELDELARLKTKALLLSRIINISLEELLRG